MQKVPRIEKSAKKQKKVPNLQYSIKNTKKQEKHEIFQKISIMQKSYKIKQVP